jgi:DNA-binding transcriptional LysR family regulator
MSGRTHPGAREWLVAICQNTGFTPKILHEAERESAAIHLVASGFGVALLPEPSKFLAHHHMVFRELRQPIASHLYAIWRADNESPSLKRYVELVKEIAVRTQAEFGA